MRRRDFISILGGAVAGWPLVARAQQRERTRRIGVLMNLAADDAEGQARLAALMQGLQAAGWAVGRNMRVDLRWGAGDADSFRKQAAELVALAPDVLFGSGTPAATPLLQATHTVPIVFAQVVDPVGAGLVSSLALARRQRHRFYRPRLWILRKMGGTAQRDRATHYAGRGASGCCH
jgi:putative ABC transport system substrate-binding protein